MALKHFETVQNDLFQKVYFSKTYINNHSNNVQQMVSPTKATHLSSL